MTFTISEQTVREAMGKMGCVIPPQLRSCAADLPTFPVCDFSLMTVIESSERRRIGIAMTGVTEPSEAQQWKVFMVYAKKTYTIDLPYGAHVLVISGEARGSEFVRLTETSAMHKVAPQEPLELIRGCVALFVVYQPLVGARLPRKLRRR